MTELLSDKLSNVLEVRARLGEGPIWDSRQQLLYWVDIYNHRVHGFYPATGRDEYFDVGDVVGAIALAGDNKLIIALRHQLAFLDTQTGVVSSIREIEADQEKNRLNDGKCDPQGRFWFGSMSSEANQGKLYRYDQDGSLHIMETGLTISNGLGWSPDQKTFYLTDSPEKKIFAYDFNSNTGIISNRRTVVDLTHESFNPDGLTIDSQGYIWSAMWNGGCVIRFSPSGEEVARIKLPVPLVTSCTFGGENLQTLYITTASVGLQQNEIDEYYYSGDVFAFQSQVAGLPSDSFRV